MQLTPSNLTAVYTALNKHVQNGFESPTLALPSYASTVASSTSAEKMPINVFSGAMREWLGSFKYDRLTVEFMTLINRDFKSAQEVSRNDIEDDQLGTYAQLFLEMGQDAGSLWARLAVEALNNPGKWADDAPFFGTRKIGNSTIKNVFKGALTSENFIAARKQMMAFMHPSGERPLGVVPDTLIVGPSLEMTAKAIVERELVAEGGVALTSMTKGLATVCMDIGITGDTWFLACCNRAYKPVVVIKRKEGAMTRQDQPSDECVEINNVNHYSIHHRGAAALTLPHLIIKGSV